MAIKDATKNIFANELMTMVSEMPFSKVRVSELCSRCGADRRTFYYHFMDKYDLAAWIFTRDYLDSLEDEHGRFSMQHNIDVLTRMYGNRDFYMAVFSENATGAYIYQFLFKLGTYTMKKHFGLRELPAEMEYSIRAYSHATVGVTMEWLSGEIRCAPGEFAELQYRYMPAPLREAFGIDDH